MRTEFSPQGFLFMLDPHVCSIRPKRRIDDYAGAIINKFKQCALLCVERQLVPVIPGDLFHRARENDLVLLSHLVDVFRLFPVPPIVMRGSHDTTETTPTDKDALMFMEKLGLIRVVAQSGAVGSFTFKETPVHLWAVPESQPIPDDIPAREGVSLMMTHHELDFTGPYPGSTPLKAIRGCDLLINGHLHTYAPPVTKGWTVCHNPGSMTRVAISQMDQAPAVWAWTPANGRELERIPLLASDDVFDLAGVVVPAISAAALKAALPKAMPVSKFAAHLLAYDGLDAGKTMDAGVLLDELQELLNVSKAPETLRAYLSKVVNEAGTAAGNPVKL